MSVFSAAIDGTAIVYPEISVTIPTFKEGTYIVETLKRLSVQTLFDRMEIVLCDYDPDGSKETEMAIRKELPNTKTVFNNLKIVYADRKGIGYARAVAVANSTKPFILTMDADCHFVKPDAIERLLEPLLRGQVDITFGANVLDTLETTDTVSHGFYFSRNELMKIAPLAYEPSLTFSRQTYQEIGGWRDVPFGEGPLLALDAVLHAKRIKYLESVAVIVSARRLATKDFDYSHAYRDGEKIPVS